jgi:TP901 family phage tail tape measure protein
MATEVADLLVSADASTESAERKLTRLGITYDETVNRFRKGNGAFISAANAQKLLEGQMDSLGKSASTMAAKIEDAGRKTATAGKAMTAGITAPLIGALGLATKLASDLESQVALISGIRPDLDTSRLNASINEMQKRIPYTMKEIGAEVYDVFSSIDDISQEAALSLTEKLGKGATGAQTDIQTFGTSVIGVMNAYHQSVGDVDHIMDVFFNTINRGVVTGGELAGNIGELTASAKLLGIDLDTLGASIAAVTKEGGSAAENMTYLNNVFSHLGGAETQKKLKEAFKIDVFDKATGQARPFLQVIGDLKTKLDELTPEARAKAISEIFPDIRGRAGINKLLSQLDFAKTVEAENQKGGKADGSADAAFQKQFETFSVQFKILKNTIVAELTTLGTLILPLITPVITWLSKNIPLAVEAVKSAFSGLPGSAQKGIGGIVAAIALLGPVAAVLGGVVAAVAAIGVKFALIAGAVVLAIGIIAGVVAAGGQRILQMWEENFGGVRDLAVQVWAAISGAFTSGIEFVQSLWRQWGAEINTTALRVWGVIQSVFTAIVGFLQMALGEAVSWVQANWPKIQETVSMVMHAMLTVVNSVLDRIKSFWATWGGAITAVAKGIWNFIKIIVSTALENIMNAVRFVMAIINGDWSKAWDAFLSIVTSIPRMLWNILVNILTVLKDLAVWALGKAKEIGLNIIKGIVEGLLAAGGMIAMTIGYILDPAIRNARDRAAAGGIQAGSAFGSNFLQGMAASMAGGIPQVAVPAGQGTQTFIAEGPNTSVNINDRPLGGGKLGGGGGKGKGGGGGGGGESAALKAARLDLQAIEIVEKAAARSYERRTADEEHFYEIGRRTIESYFGALDNLENERYQSQLKIAQAELAVAQQTGKANSRERTNAVAEANDKIVALNEEHQQKLIESDRKAQAERLALSRQLWGNETNLLEEYAAGVESIYSRLAERGVLTFMQAQEAISGQQAELLLREKRRLENELKEVDPQSPKGQALDGQLKIQLQKIENFNKLKELLDVDAKRKELDRERDHAGKLRSISETIEDMERDTQADRLRMLEAAGVRREVIWKKQRDFDLEQERINSQRRIEELQRDNEYLEKFEDNLQRRAELIEANNRLIEAEEKRSAQRRANIEEEFYEKHREKLKRWADQIVDVFEGALGKLKDEGWGGFFRHIGESFRDLLLKMATDLLKSQVYKILTQIFKIPQPGTATGGAQSGSQQGGGTTDIFGSIFNSIRNIFNPSGQGSGVGENGNSASDVRAAGEEMSTAITAAGQKGAQEVERSGEAQSRGLSTIGLSLVQGLSQIAAIIATSGGRGSFWKGLFAAAATGFVNGLMNGIGGGLTGEGGEGGGGSPGTGAHEAIHTQSFATGGLLRGPGTSTSDSILGLDRLTNLATAWVSKDEYVLNAASVAKIGLANVEYMNAFGRLPRQSYQPPVRLASGGAVSRNSFADAYAQNGHGQQEMPTINVYLKPDAQGRVRSKRQVAVELTYQSNAARRDM